MRNNVGTCKGHGSYNMTQSFCPDVIVSKVDFSGKNFKCHYLENKAVHPPPPPRFLHEIQCRLHGIDNSEEKKRGFPCFGKVIYIYMTYIYFHQ